MIIRDKALAEEANQLEILKTVAGVYAQLSSLFMNHARMSVLKSRDYLEELNSVFLAVFSSYVEEVQILAKKRHMQRNCKITFLAHNGKKVAVFLSANAGFYGEIVQKTFQLFLKDVRENGAETTIVVRQGRVLFIAEEPNHPHTFFDFPDERIDHHQFTELIKHLVKYEEI